MTRPEALAALAHKIETGKLTKREALAIELIDRMVADPHAVTDQFFAQLKQTFSEEELQGISSEIGTKVGGFIRGEISQANHHGQILADALMDNEEGVESERAIVIDRLRDRWLILTAALDEGYKQYGKEKLWDDPCNGGFFCYVNLAKGLHPKEIAQRLITEKKVGVVPSDQGLRVAFAGVPKEKIPAMIQAIFEVVHA